MWCFCSIENEPWRWVKVLRCVCPTGMWPSGLRGHGDGRAGPVLRRASAQIPSAEAHLLQGRLAFSEKLTNYTDLPLAELPQNLHLAPSRAVLVHPLWHHLHLFLQSVEGLSSFRHRKVGKKSELTLVWLPEDLEEAPIEQVRNTHTYDYGHFHYRSFLCSHFKDKYQQ